jgi:hypothetical protein
MPVLVPNAKEFRDLQARVTALENVVTEPPEPEPEPEPEPPPAGTMQAVVTVDGHDYVFNERDAADIGNYTDPDGRFVMACKRATHPGLDDYRVDFRRMDGWRCVVFDRSNGLIAEPPTNLGLHTVVITDDAGEHVTFELPAHYWSARWRWQSGPWPHMRDVDDLVARNWLPKLDPALHKGTAKPLPIPVYQPMGLAGLTAQMPGTGGRADIGFLTDWQAEYLCTRSPEMLAGVFAQGEAGGTIPWHIRDLWTGRLMDLMNTWRFASCYWNSSVNPYVYPAPGTGIVIDSSHQPSCAWLPFALTGDPYFLETVQAQANFAFLEAPRSWEWVWQVPGYGQTRAMAWNLRTIAQALAGTPEDAPAWLLPRSVIRQMLGQCVKGFDCIMNEGGTNRLGGLHCIDVGLPGPNEAGPAGWYPGSCYSRCWQTSFFCQAAAFAAVLFPELSPVAGYIAHNQIARTDGKVWDASYPAPYALLLRHSTADGAWFKTWEECWVANAAVLGVPVAPLKNQLTAVGDYEGGVYAGLAALAHARAQGVLEIPEEIDAVLARYAGQMSALLGTGNNYLAFNNSYAR